MAGANLPVARLSKAALACRARKRAHPVVNGALVFSAATVGGGENCPSGGSTRAVPHVRHTGATGRGWPSVSSRPRPPQPPADHGRARPVVLGPRGQRCARAAHAKKCPHSDAHAPRGAVAADPFGCGGRRRRAAPHRPSNRHGCGGGGGGRVRHGESPTAAGHASQAWWRERKSSRTGRLRHRAHTVGLPPRMTRRSYGRGRCRSERAGGC